MMFLAKCFGFTPISLVNKTKNAVTISCYFIVNQIRNFFWLYIHVKSLYFLGDPVIYGVSECVTVLLHNIFVSKMIYVAATEVDFWQKLIKHLKFDNTGYRWKISLCFICYAALVLFEINFFSMSTSTDIETIYTWFSFHLSQCINYFLVCLLQYIISALSKAHKHFEDDFQKEINSIIMKSLGNEVRGKFIFIGKKYHKLYDLNREFNEVFGSSLSLSMCSIFSNILCGAQVFSKPLLGDEAVLHIFTFCIQMVISLVSLISSVFIRSSVGI